MVSVGDDDFLPDLPDEISGEQIAFQQKAFRSNEVFNKSNNDIILWFKSPPERRQYPKSGLKNKNAFRKHIKKYSYDSKSGILYKTVKASDGIGEYNAIFIWNSIICAVINLTFLNA